MPLVSKPNTPAAGGVIIAANTNSNLDTLYNLVNGLLDKDNLSATAGIVDTQLAQLSTASKVSGTAITGLASLPSAAGVIPIANLATGTPTGAKFLRDDGALAVPVATSKMILQSILTQSSAVAQSTGTAIYDDTIPTLTECPVIAALNTAITASGATNTLIITLTLNLSQDASNSETVVAVFLDAGTAAICANGWYIDNAVSDQPTSFTMQFSISAVDTNAHTYKVGIGGVLGAVVTLNGVDGVRNLGGVCYSSMRIDEVKA
jgi:hypothetical protein